MMLPRSFGTSATWASAATGYPRSPQLLRGGLVQIDTTTRTVVRVVSFQYNPDSVTRSLQTRGMTTETSDRLEAQRLTGPPKDTVKFEAELDATDQLEHPDDATSNPIATHGLLPVLANLEALITPSVDQIKAVDSLFDRGALEIAPAEAPLTLLVWGAKRVLPILVTSLTITEEAFDPALHPIRAKVAVECRVLTTNDLPVQHLGGALFLAHRHAAETLAASVATTNTRNLGFEQLP